MELYTLDDNFLREDLIDRFLSVVWTERYSQAGDINLVVDATPEMISKLVEGTKLSRMDSKEIMLVDTVSIENDKMTVTGSSLLGFLKDRMIFTGAAPIGEAWYYGEATPGDFITFIIDSMLIPGGTVLTGSEVVTDLQRITNLSLGAIDNSDPIVSPSISVPQGPLYEGISTLIELYKLGWSLYLDSADAGGYSLKFTTYKGLDRTSTQDINEMVRFSPGLDSLTNIKELHSIVNYRNVVYLYSPRSDAITGGFFGPGIAYADVAAETAIDFERRILIAEATDIPTAYLDDDMLGPLSELLAEKAKLVLALNNRVSLVDGEIVSQGDFQYGVDYNLGDIVELQGYSGALQKARVIEYIHAEDTTGNRAYPTISVIE